MKKVKICGIYCIENLVNGKKYIGLSTNVKKRWKRHIANLKNNKHINDHLQSAWNKYKAKSFKFYILEECKETRLFDREIHYISFYKANNRDFGYNKTSGGDGVKNASPETLEKMSLSATEYPVIQLSLSGEFISKHRNCVKAAKALTEDDSVIATNINSITINIRACCVGQYGCKSAYGYMWIYAKDYSSDKKYIYKKDIAKKAVCQYDEDGNLINTYESAREAERKTGIKFASISEVCTGRKRIAYDYIWRFEGDSFYKYETRNTYLKPVKQYDVNGNLIRLYKSVSEAEKETGVGSNQISQCCSGDKKIVHGYVWRFKDDDFYKYSIKGSKRKNAPVDQYDIYGNFIATYGSAAEIKRLLGIDVSNAITGRSKTAGGYKWARYGEKLLV